MSVTDETMEELGRLLNMDPGGEAFAWLDTRTGELVLTTSLYGLDPDREEGDDDESIEEHEGAARLPVSGRRSLPDWMEAERRQVEAISADTSGRYRRVPIGVEHGAPGVLESFARTLTDAILRDEVRDAMRGRGAFRRVKDLLHRREKLDLWRRYEDERQLACAREWLASEGIRLDDAQPPSPALEVVGEDEDG